MVNGRAKDCDVTWLYGPLQSQAGALSRAHTVFEPEMPRWKMSRSSPIISPSKPILKKRSRSEVMLTSFSGRTPGNFQAERQRGRNEQQFREAKRKNPLTPTHVLCNQQQIPQKSSTDMTSLSRDSPFTVNQNFVTSVCTDYFGEGSWMSLMKK